MNIARGNHTATLLDNGLVLVVGGPGPASGTAELYNPVTGIWRLTRPLNVPRIAHTATKLNNGQVLIAGGVDGATNHLDSAELFDPITESFTSVAPMITARTNHYAVRLPDGRVMVLGGTTGNTEIFELTDAATGKWTAAASVPDAPTNANGSTATLVAGKVLFLEGGFRASNAAWLYDPLTDTWKRATDLLERRQSHNADVLPGGKVLVTGGQHGQCNISDTVLTSELYDVDANGGNGLSTFGPDLIERREQHTSTPLANGDVLLFGGQRCHGPGGLATSAERYSVKQNAFITLGNPGQTRVSHTATLLPSGRVLIVGGYPAPNGPALSTAVLWPAGAPNDCGLEPTISFARPNRGGNAGSVTITIEGCGFRAGGAVKLSRLGLPDIGGAVTAINEFGTAITATFNLNDRQTGLYDITFTDGVGRTVVSPGSFTVEAGGAPDVRISKTGTTPVPGRALNYIIAIENRGNVDGSGVVAEALEPWFSFVSASPAPASTKQGRDTFPDLLPSPMYTAFLYWPYTLGPGQSRVLIYSARLDPDFRIGDEVRGCACNTPSQDQADVCTDIYEVDLWRAGQQPIRAIRQSMELLACRNFIVCCGGGWSDRKIATAPEDPNEKLTSHPTFVRFDQMLTYAIHYENVGNAEARDIFITDIFDPNLDTSTLQLLTPGATFDPATRTVKWSLLNVDLPPTGTGNVLLSIKPRPNLPSGTVIRNKATIRFEIFAPLTTNETVNIIDSTPPVCSVNPLPAQTTSTTIPVSWLGTDEVGEVDSVSVFVAEDNGPFTPWLVTVKENSGTFNGKVGKTYRFYCTATDTVGNSEAQAPAAEAQTTIVESSLQISTATLPTGRSGVPYLSQLAATGGVAPYKWHIVEGRLPSGLSLNQGTGVISGIPSTAMEVSIVVEVVDSSSPHQTARRSFVITTVPNTLSITTRSLPVGHVGAPYSATIDAIGGTPPYRWSIDINSSLPSGLSLSATTGEISGIPAAVATTARFAMRVTDSGSTPQTAVAQFLLTIVPGTFPQ